MAEHCPAAALIHLIEEQNGLQTVENSSPFVVQYAGFALTSGSLELDFHFDAFSHTDHFA